MAKKRAEGGGAPKKKRSAKRTPPREEGKASRARVARAAEFVPDDHEVEELRRIAQSSASTKKRNRKKVRRLLWNVFHRDAKGDPANRDKYFALSMAIPKVFAETMKVYYPDLAKVLDFDRGRLAPTTRNRMFDRKIADFAVIVPVFDPNLGEFEIMPIVEHKAQSGRNVDRTTLINAAQYAVLSTADRLKETIEAERDGKTRICPRSLIVVFFTGADENWTAPSMDECFPVPTGLEKYAFHMDVQSVNITKLWKEGALKGSPHLRAIFTALAAGGSYQISEFFVEIIGLFNQIENFDDDARYSMRSCITYAFQTAGQSGQRITPEIYAKARKQLENREMQEEMEIFRGFASEEELDARLKTGIKTGGKGA